MLTLSTSIFLQPGIKKRANTSRGQLEYSNLLLKAKVLSAGTFETASQAKRRREKNIAPPVILLVEYFYSREDLVRLFKKDQNKYVHINSPRNVNQSSLKLVNEVFAPFELASTDHRAYIDARSVVGKLFQIKPENYQPTLSR
jgi:hypothetical protein